MTKSPDEKDKARTISGVNKFWDEHGQMTKRWLSATLS